MNRFNTCLKCLAIAMLCVPAVAPVMAQPAAGTVSGTVVDESGGALADVQVVAESSPGTGRQTLSDAQGRFAIAGLSPGRYVVTAQRSGFAPARMTDVVVAAGAERTIAIEMKIAPLNETVSVRVAPAEVRTTPSTIDVAPTEVRSVAGAGENIFHVLQTLPGIVAVNDFDSRLSVRGGGPDQNLTMMDGVEIHNPYRLFGLVSAFNPETVERFELSAGGFSAKYGDRLSSILVIDNRAGTGARRLTGSASMAFTDANVVTEGKIAGGAGGSWLVTARRTYYDLVAERIVDTDLPGFTDLQARVAVSPRAGQRLTFSGLTSRERTDALFDDDSDDETLKLVTDTNNDLAAVSYSLPVGTRTSSATTVSWYRNAEFLDFDGDFRTESRRSNRPDEEGQPLSNVLFTRTATVRDIAVRQEFVIRAASAHLLETGFEHHALETEWGWQIKGDRNADEPNGSSALGGAGLPSSLDSLRSSRRAGAWLTDRWSVTPRLRAEPGVRVDWSGLSGEVLASPRIAVSADVGAGMSLRVAGGLFTQSPGYEKLFQSDYFVDLGNADTLGLRSERAWHGVVGVERRFGPAVTARVEGYYKHFDRLIVGRLETDEEFAARLATYDFPAALGDQLPRAPQVTSVPGNDATGRAYGVEFYVARPALSASDRLTGWASYTLGRAETTAYDRTYAADYDRAHALSLVANYRLSRLIEIGTTVRAQSGFPLTTPLGVVVSAVADSLDADRDGNVTELVPQRDADGLLVWTPDYGDSRNFNSGRLPAFVRVDVRATFRPRWQNNRWLLYAEVINVLNRENVGNLQTELVYDPDSDRPGLTAASSETLRLLPSIGVRFKF